MAGTEPKRHHVVPDFYLRRFADRDGKITAVRLDAEGHEFTTSTKKVAVENLFYALPTDSGWDYTIENELSKLESLAAVDIENLASNRKSSTLPAFRTRLSFFLAVQFCRGRRPREQMIDFFKELNLKMLQLSTPEMFRADAQKRGEEMTSAEAEELVRFARKPDLKVGIGKVGPMQLPGESLVHATLFRDGQELIPFFFRRGWTIVDFDAPVLLTSDEPVVVTLDASAPNHPAGVANADSILFALDPYRALVMTRPDVSPFPHMRRKGSMKEATAINQFIVFYGAKQLFHHPETDPLPSLGPPFSLGRSEKRKPSSTQAAGSGT